MPVIKKHLTNFTSGEFSPFVQIREDIQQYNNSASTIQNFVIRPQGGLTKRPGTVFVHEIKNSANDARLVPFQYSTSDAYVLEMGAGYFRFFRNGGILLSTAAITNGTFTTDLTGWTDGDTGTGVSTQTAGVMRLNGGAAGVAIRTQAITFMGTSQYTLTFTVATNTCTYKIGTTSGGTEIATGTGAVGANSINFTPTTAGTVYLQFSNSANNNSDVDTVAINAPVYQIDNPFSQADIDEVQFIQTFDHMYFAHGDYAPRELIRYGHSNWTIGALEINDGVYFDRTHRVYGGTGSGITINPSAATGTITLTASASLFMSTDVGRLIRFRSTDSVAWGWGTITAYTSATSVTCVVQRTFTATGASLQWRLGAWSATTGYPQCISFFEQRLIFSTTSYQQQSIWFSVAGDLNNFQPDDNNYKDAPSLVSAMSYTIADNHSNVISWIYPKRVLFLGTSSGVWIAKASTVDEALTSDTLNIRAVISEGVASLPPIEARSALLYPQYLGKKFLEVGYNFSDDTYKAADLAILAEHRLYDGMKWSCFQANPNYLIWNTTQTGGLNSLTYIREQNVVGWAEHVIGGTAVNVKSICTITTSTTDQVWMIISRTINGSTKQYVEYLSSYFIDQEVSDAIFVDSSINYSGGATSTLSGLDHLEGQTVSVFSNGGVVVATTAVTSGAITLAETVTSAVVGLSYDSIVHTNPFVVDTPAGNTSGRLARLARAVLQVYRSYGGKIGTSSTDLTDIPEFSSNTTMDSALSLYTSTAEFIIPGSWEYEPRLYIKHSLPVPFTLLGISGKISI